MDSHYHRLFSAPILHYKHHCLETSLPRHGKSSVIGSSISFSWRLQSASLLAGYRGILGTHHCGLEASLHPQELDLTHLPAPQPERVGADCHSGEYHTSLSQRYKPWRVAAVGKGDTLRTTSTKTSPAVELSVTPDGTVCLPGRKEMTIKGRTPHGCSVGELRHNLRARLCGAGL